MSSSVLLVVNQTCTESNVQKYYVIDCWYGSSLFYNMSVRHEQHECDTSDMNTTRVQHERHECSTSETLVQRECHTSDTTATRVKNFVFDNGTSENMSSHPYIYYMANERLQEEEQFHSKNYLWKSLFPMSKCI